MDSPVTHVAETAVKSESKKGVQDESFVDMGRHNKRLPIRMTVKYPIAMNCQDVNFIFLLCIIVLYYYITFTNKFQVKLHSKIFCLILDFFLERVYNYGMKEISVKKITYAVKELVHSACFSLAPGVVDMMRCAEQKEKSDTTKFALKTLCDNAQLAHQCEIPVCQDTGMAIVFAEIGQDVRLTGGSFSEAVNEGVRQGYKEFHLRNSVLDPISRKNTGDNTPAIIHTTITDGDKIKLTLLPKGFGSENMSKLYMLTPAAGINGVMDKVVEAVKLAGSNPCPPIIVGVGIGGTADYAMLLAKKALLRSVGEASPDPQLREMEETLLKRINELGIGAQGFGGSVTALEVRVEKYPTHIAALPVGISIQCNAHRMAKTEVL